ncbi:hypothetical protein D9Q98_010064 [Chlorella vulgaris]|uniref:Uncharacterized protein n=1 Tax=Chlorella vulgaris TaxID=3077 RepID=A0A9D4TMT7_CHLVU|nr:hypothetical protein D9Q98_010064 [Chlorella vulgaris]
MSALRLAGAAAARRLDGLESRQHPRISSLRGVNQPPPHFLACRAWRDGRDPATTRGAPLETPSPPPLATSSHGSPSLSAAEAAEVVKQLASMQRFLGTLATKDDLDALKATAEATNARFVATGAKFEDLKADLQAINRQLARMHRKTGELEEGMAETAVQMSQYMRAGRAEHSKAGRVAKR